MQKQNWPISRVNKHNLNMIGIPQRLGDDQLHSKDTFDSTPCLEEIVGENWESSLLSKLLQEERILAWWTSTKVFKKSGLQDYHTNKLIDPLDISKPLKNILIRRFTFQGRILVALDASDSGVKRKICDWSGGDTEVQPEFIWSAPTTAGYWDTSKITDWCRSRKKWATPYGVLPSHARRVIALFDGDIYCAAMQADADAIMSVLFDLADSWNIAIGSGHDKYSWIPAQTTSSSLLI